MAFSLKDLKEKYTNCILSENDNMISKKQEYEIDKQLSDMYSFDYINNSFLYETEGYFINILLIEDPLDYNLVVSNLLNLYRNKGWNIELSPDNGSMWIFKTDTSFQREETINNLLLDEKIK